MKQLRKKLALICAAIFLLAVLLLCACIGYLKSNHALSLLTEQINGHIPGRIYLANHSFSLFAGQLELKNFKVFDNDNKLIAGFDRLFINIAWAALFNKEICIEQIIVEKPWSDIQSDDQNRLNLISAFTSDKKGTSEKEEKDTILMPFAIVLKKGVIDQSSFTFSHGQNGFQVETGRIDMAAGIDPVDLSGDLAMDAGRIKFKNTDIDATFEQAIVHAAFAKGSMAPVSVRLKTRESNLFLSGRVNRVFEKADLALALDFDLSIDEIDQWLENEFKSTGRIKGKLTAKGNLDDPALSLSMDYGGGKLHDQPIDHVNIDLTLSEKKIILSQLSIQAAGGTSKMSGRADLGTLFPNGLLSPAKKTDAVTYTLKGENKKIDLGELLKEVAEVKGMMSGGFLASGRGFTPGTMQLKTDLDLVLEGFSTSALDTVVDTRLSLASQLDHKRVTVESLTLDTGQVRVRTSGTLFFDSRTMEAVVTADVPELSVLLSSLGDTDAGGQFHLDAVVSGSMEQPIFDVSLMGNNLFFKHIRMGDLAVSARVDEAGNLNIFDLSIGNKAASISGQGSIHLFENGFHIDKNPEVDLNFHFKNVAPAAFYAPSPLDGSFRGSGRIKGLIQNPFAAVELEGKNLSVKDLSVKHLKAKAELKEGMVAISTLDLKEGNTSLAAKGTVRLFEENLLMISKDPDIRLAIEGNKIRIQDFVEGYKGLISFNADLSGRVSEPKGTVNLTGSSLDLGFQKIKDVNLSASLANRAIAIDAMEIAITDQDKISGTGRLAMDRSFDITLTTKRGINLDAIDRVREYDIAKGLLTLDIKGSGVLDQPRITGNLAIKDIMINEKKLADMALVVRVQDDQAQIAGDLGFDLAGNYHLKKKDFTLNLDLDHTQLDPYFKIFDLARFSGSATGRVEIAGNSEFPEASKALLEMSLLDLMFDQHPLIWSDNIAARLYNQKVTIPGIRLALLEKGFLDLKGKGNLKGDVDFEFEGRIPLEVLKPFDERLAEIRGGLEISAIVRGNLPKPDLTATLGFNQAGLTLPVLEQVLENVNGIIRISPEKLTIDNLTGKLGNGRFDADGMVAFDDFIPREANVNLNAHNLPINLPQTMDLVINSMITLTGNRENILVAGDVTLLEGTYYKNIDASLLGGLTRRSRPSTPARVERRNRWLKNMQYDITINHRTPFIVDNNLALLEIAPDLHLTGSGDAPVLGGRTEVRSGEIYYQKKTFEVEKGVVDFINPHKIEPEIDIQSNVTVRKWDISLTVTGTPDDLLFTLTSDPREEDEDILSILLFGKTTKELISGEGGSTLSTAQLLTGFIATSFGDDIKKTTGIDILEVDTTHPEDKENSERIKVTMGKKLSKRLTLKYAIESIDGEMSHRAISEYKLLEHILMSGFQDNHGTFGGELVFRVEFR